MDGLTGCYRGLVPKVCGNLVGAVASQKVLDKFDAERDENIEDEERSDAYK